MRAGKLKHRLTLQYRTDSRNEYGEKVSDTWNNIATVYADLRPVTGQELIRAGADRAVGTHIATVRHRGVVSGEWTFVSGEVVEYAEGGIAEFVERATGEAQRAVYGNMEFDVVSVIDKDEAHRFDEIVLRQVKG